MALDLTTPSIDPAAASGFDAIDTEDLRRWLIDTPLLQCEHPKLRLTALRLTQLKVTPAQKAVACYRHVRKLPFGCIADSMGANSLTVLKDGMGDCHTKSTLLVALLRASGIPARMRFVTLKSDFLQGIVELEDQPIEHAFVEVYLNGGWLAVESHVVDMNLAVAAKTRLRQEGRQLGYGMHVNGTITWDAKSHAFAQFHADDAGSLPMHDWGVFDDPHQFYTTVPAVKHRLHWTTRVKWLVGAQVVNRRVSALRHMAGDSAP